MTFGEKIRLLRKNLKLSQAEFADKLQIGRTTITMWESDKIKPHKKTITKICKTFKIEEDWFLNDLQSSESFDELSPDNSLLQILYLFESMPLKYKKATNAMMTELLKEEDTK